jgi:hypothetical protein
MNLSTSGVGLSALAFFFFGCAFAKKELKQCLNPSRGIVLKS